MSTRASIQIWESDNPDCRRIYLYRHCDGYPDTTGRELNELLQKNKAEWIRDDEKIATDLVRHTTPYQHPITDRVYHDFNYEVAIAEHGDEEYKYIINARTLAMTVFEKRWRNDCDEWHEVRLSDYLDEVSGSLKNK